jgi:anti-sigma regulatory factor (Ser/Thr protein kinase)
MSGPHAGAVRVPALGAFEHEAFLYAGARAFLDGTVPFIQAGLEADEPVLVVVAPEKIAEMQGALGDDAHGVSFADMGLVGRNPARIIPAWRDFLAQNAGRPPARGIGEPVWAGRTTDELAECQRHEALLNVAFASGAPWRLLCPYDTASLGPDVLQEARHSHRFVTRGRALEECDDYQGDDWPGSDDRDLPEPPGHAVELRFGAGPLEPVRRFVVDRVAADLGPVELVDLLQAVTEAAGNSLVHGGGSGTLRLWTTATGVVCEVRDKGWVREPLVGRARPSLERESGRGLWMVNQLCDLVQLRSSPAGTVVRMHMHQRGSANL